MEQKVEVEEEQEVEIKVEENPSVDSNTKDNATSAPEVVVSEEKPEDKEEELDDYSKRVQKRIKTLTEKYRNEEREREEATRFAATVKAENDDLKKRLANLDTGYLNEYGTRLESQLSSAKQLFKEARDAGDSEKEFEAQQALAKITVEQERYRLAKQRQEQNKVEVQKAPQQQPQQSQPQPQPQPDEKAKNWAEKNEWFGQDEIMTYAAFGLHRKLTEEEGFDAKSDEYYNEIDSRMRAEFPHKFKNSVPKNGGSTRVASADTSASRTKNTGRRTVKLSPSQIAIAKKLGVPLEEYAKYVKD